MEGLRKVISGLIILGVAVAITYFKGDVPKGLGDVLIYLFGFFVVGNALEHGSAAFTEAAYAKAEAASTQAPPAPMVDMEPVIQAIAAQKAALEELQKAPTNTQDLEQVKTAINGVVNQNAVLAQNLNQISQALAYVVSVIQKNAS